MGGVPPAYDAALGAIHGEEAIPAHLLEALEGREVIEQVADDLLRILVVAEGDVTREDISRYPGVVVPPARREGARA